MHPIAPFVFDDQLIQSLTAVPRVHYIIAQARGNLVENDHEETKSGVMLTIQQTFSSGLVIKSNLLYLADSGPLAPVRCYAVQSSAVLCVMSVGGYVDGNYLTDHLHVSPTSPRQTILQQQKVHIPTANKETQCG